MPAHERHAFQEDPIHALIVVSARQEPSLEQSAAPKLWLVELNHAEVNVNASKVTIRPLESGDLEPLNDMYNRYIADTHYTFDLEPLTLAAREEWSTHYASTGRYRVLVALSEGTLIGYASSSRYRSKAAYETSVETSIYLATEATGLGIGSKLYKALFDALSTEDVHRALAGIALPNPASLALHERFGFKKVAHFTEQGRKFDRYWDVAWFEKAIGGHAGE
jgi:phosphinothricin acetyltransferase